MIAAGNADLADFVGSLLTGEVSIEGIDDAIITAAVTADGAGAGVDNFKGTGVEMEDLDLIGLKIQEHFALGAHDIGLAATLIEGTHSERNGAALGKLQIHHLMIHHLLN